MRLTPIQESIKNIVPELREALANADTEPKCSANHELVAECLDRVEAAISALETEKYEKGAAYFSRAIAEWFQRYTYIMDSAEPYFTCGYCGLPAPKSCRSVIDSVEPMCRSCARDEYDHPSLVAHRAEVLQLRRA